MYIANNIPYKPRNDLNICKTNEIRYTFLEIAFTKKSNIIMEFIYRHLFSYPTDFESN